MVLDAIIVGLVVLGAVGYLAWRLVPRKRAVPAPCAACPSKAAHSVPVRMRG